MSYGDNYLKLRAQRTGGTTTTDGTTPSVASGTTSGDETDSFGKNYLALREKRNAQSISEKAETKTRYATKGLAEIQRASPYSLAGVRNRTTPSTRKTTTGGYYSMPEFGSRSEELYNQVTGMEPALTEKRTTLETVQSSMQQAQSDLQTVQNYLNQAKSAYDADPSEENATSYNQIVGAWEIAKSNYNDAYSAYENAYNDYKDYENQMVDALVAYRIYNDQQQKDFDNWKGTIRESDAVLEEIDRIEEDIAKIKEKKRKLESLQKQYKEQLGEDYTNRLAGYEEQIAQLENALALAQEELGWSQYYKYQNLTGAEDFAEKSQYVSTANGTSRSWLDILLDRYDSDNSGWDDPLYEYINGNEEAGAYLSNAAAAGGDGALDTLVARSTGGDTESQQMTEEEIAIFNYLYATQGKEKAHEYYEYLHSDLNARQRAADEAYWTNWAADKEVLASLFSIAESPLKGLSFLNQAADYLTTGIIDQNAAYNKFSYTNSAIRGTVAQKIAESGKWGSVGSFLYQTGMSMADNLVNIGLGGGNETVTLAIMCTGAAADEVIARKDQGLTDDQAFALGTIAGLAEYFTEKVSLDTLLNAELLKDGTMKYVLKNMLAEGSEEIGSDVINLLADILIAQDEGNWRQSIAAYVEQGETESTAFGLAVADMAMVLAPNLTKKYAQSDDLMKSAFGQALIDQLKEMALDGLGGALSGGVLSGTGAMIYVNSTNKLGKGLQGLNLDDSDIQTFIETGLESDPDTAAYSIATELQAKIDAGDTLNGYDLARLYQANVQAVEGENSAVGAAETTDEASDGLTLPVPDETNETGTASSATTEGGTLIQRTALRTDTEMSVAQQLRQAQAENGGTENEGQNDAERYGSTGLTAAQSDAGRDTASTFALPGGDDLLNGSQQRDAGTGAGEQVGSLAESTKASRLSNADIVRTSIDRQNYIRSLRLPQISSQELGLKNGTDTKNIQVIPQEHWDSEMVQLADRMYNETGKNMVYVKGTIDVRGVNGGIQGVRGVITGDQMIVRVDNFRASMEQIADHEAFHTKMDWAAETSTDLHGQIREYIIEKFSQEQFRKVMEKYIEGLRGVIDVRNARTGEAFESMIRQVEEEVFADAYAGINAFGAHAEMFTQAVNEKMRENYLGKLDNQDNGTRQTNAPNERYSYAGEKANTADMEALERAKEMAAANVDIETIRQETGWYTGMDGKWRWELDDSAARYRPDGDARLLKEPGYSRLQELTEKWAENDGLLSTGEQLEMDNLQEEYADQVWAEKYMLSDFLQHDELYKAYPEMRYASVVFADLPDGTNGSYNRRSNTIILSNTLLGSPEKTLLHEVQHMIQKKEGFTGGSSTQRWNGILESDGDIQSRGLMDARKELSQFENDPNNAEVIRLAEKLREADTKDDESAYNALWSQAEEVGLDDEINRYYDLQLEVDIQERRVKNMSPSELYYNTAGEIEARDVAQRRELNAQQRRETIPNLGDSRTVFAEEFDEQSFAEMDAEYGPQMQSYFDPDVSTEEIDSNIQRVAQMDPIVQISGEEFAKGTKDLTTQVEEFFARIGNFAHNEQLGDVVLDRRGVKNDIAHGVGRKKAAAFAAVPDVIEQGLVVDYQQNWKGRGYDTAVVAAPITIGAEEHHAAVVLTRSNQTNRFYVHEVLTTKDGAMPFKTGTHNMGEPGGSTPSVLNILEHIRSVKYQNDRTAEYSVHETGASQRNENVITDIEGDEVPGLRMPSLEDVEDGGMQTVKYSVDEDTAVMSNENGTVQQRIGRLMEQYQIAQARGDKEQMNTLNNQLRRALGEASPKKKAAPKKTVKSVAEAKAIQSKRDMKTDVLNLFSVPAGQRSELGEVLDGYADRLLKNGTLTEEDRQHLFDRLYQSGVMTMQADEYMAEGRSYLVDGRIYVSDSVVADLGDDWNDLRRRAFAAGVYLTRSQNVNGRSVAGVDVWNQEMASTLPWIFDENETDMRLALEKMIQVAEEGKDEHLSLPEYTAQLAGEEHISEAEVLDNLERQLDWMLRTFAEKAGLEIKLRERTGVKIAEERAAGKERLDRRRTKEIQRRAAEKQARQEATQRARERKNLQELQQKTLKQLQWLKKNQNRAPEDLKAQFDEVLGDLDIYAVSAANEMNWSKKHNATWQDLAQIYKDAQKNDPNFLPSGELEKIVARLDNAKIADMDVGALSDLYKVAIGLRTEFYNRNNVINDDMHRLFAEVYTDAKQEIENAPGKYSGKDMDKLFNLQQLTAMNVMQRMGGWDPDGAFYSMAKQLERGERDIRAYKVKANRMLENFLTENADWVKTADGQGKDAVWYKIEIPELIALELSKKPEFGKTITVWMTPAQKVHMYLESKNTDNLRHMTGGRTFVNKELYSDGKRTEAFAQGTTVRMAPETVKAIVSDLTAQERELAGLLEQYYNSFASKEINRISNTLYGYDKAITKNYAPIYTNQNYTKTEFGKFDVTAEGVGNLKGRQYAVNPSYNISAFDAFEKHMDQTSRFVGMAIPARNWTTLMNWRESNNSTADVITHKWGQEGKSYITDLITTLQEGGGNKSDVVQSKIEKLRSNYISAVFGANPSIVLKQLGSIPLAAAYLDAKNFPSFRQIASIDRQLISQYTQDLEWRTMGYSMPETKTLKENPNWTQSNKVANFLVGGGAITAMDGWAASVLWPWAENKVSREFPELSRGTDVQIQNGQSLFYQKVAEEFENAVARSQSTSDEIHQGTLRKSKNPFTQVFTMFRSDSAQTYNVLRQKIGEAQYYARTGADAKTIRTARKAVGTAALSALVGCVWAEAVELIMNLWKHKGKSYRDDDGELTAESIAGEMVSGLVGDIAGVVVGGEELYDFLGGLLTDGTLYGVETMGLEQLNDCAEAMWDAGRELLDVIADSVDILKDGGDLGEYFRRHGNNMLGSVKDVANAAAMYISGFPAENLEKYLLGGMKWLAPEMQAEYEDLLSTPSKTDLSGLNGDALAARVGDMIDNRGITASEETARALAQLYEAGEKSAIFSDTPSSISINDEKRSLSAYQQQTYDAVWANVVSEGLDELVGSEAFIQADEATRAKMLSSLYSYAAEQAKAVVFEDYEMDTAAAKNAEIVAAGASVAECITWNTTTSGMKTYEKVAYLAQWDLPEDAKRAIFTSKISDSREDTIEAILDTGLSFNQFLEAYSEYSQIYNMDLKANEKAVEFSYWADAQGYTAQQAGAIKDELSYFAMTPASSSKYDKFVETGMDMEDAYTLTGILNALEPESGADEVSDLQKWRACIDFSSDVEDQLTALSAVMTNAQFQKVEIANDFGVAPDVYVTLQEIKQQYDEDGNGSYKNSEIQAAIDGMPGYYTSAQKAVLWQLATGSTSAKNNPYSRDVGQQVLDARAAAKEATAQEQTGATTDATDDDSFSQELLNQLLGRG